MIIRLASCVGASAVLAACSLAPPYVRPGLPTPETYPAKPAAQASIVGLGWRQLYSDPDLTGLIEAALANNRDVRVATARMAQARAGVRIEGSGLYPQLAAVAAGTRGRTPADLSITGQATTSAQYQTALSAAWELDLWGRIASQREAALQRYLATEAGRRAVATSLIAQVAGAYLLDREYEERLALARRTLATREDAVRIMRRRYEVGAGSKFDMTQSQLLLGQARTALEGLEGDREVNRNGLQLLVGRPIELAPGGLSLVQAALDQPLPAGLPSDLLTHRPDIAAAEAQLRAANADIGAARAAFFPEISLTGAYGSTSAALDGLFKSGSSAWSFAPALTLPLFTAGRSAGNLDLAEARRTEAVAVYEQTVQQAFRDVSDALTRRRQLAAQIDNTQVVLAALTERARLADLRFGAGRSTYLEVLDAQRDLFETEQALVQLRRARLASGVALYAALGGGPEDGASFTPPSQTIQGPPR